MANLNGQKWLIWSKMANFNGRNGHQTVKNGQENSHFPYQLGFLWDYEVVVEASPRSQCLRIGVGVVLNPCLVPDDSKPCIFMNVFG